jgi:periplasmic protein TonB
VVVQFVILSNGVVTDAKVLKGISESIDKEALRVIGVMPRWQPGKQNGKPVNVRYMLPIIFALD